MQIVKATDVQRAVTYLITEHPFFASLLLKHNLTPTQDIPTACVTPTVRISYNPDWFDTLHYHGIAFVLAHECSHPMYEHHLRRGWRDPNLWNKAGDAVINETLKACGVGIMPADGIEFPGAENMTTEQVYEKMKGDPKYDNGEPAPWDDLKADDGQPLDESTKTEVQAEMRVLIQQAADTAKRIGKLPALIERLVDDLVKVKTPWYEKFMRFMTRSVDSDYSYENLDRRFIHQRVYLPWFSGTGLQKVCIVIDASGSVTDPELNCFGGHTNKILDTCQPAELYVIFCTTRVVGTPVRYTPEDYPANFRCSESGGTHMPAGIDWVMENHPDTNCIVVLTDGETDFGDDPGIPTFWAITRDYTAPWGETVKLEVEA